MALPLVSGFIGRKVIFPLFRRPTSRGEREGPKEKRGGEFGSTPQVGVRVKGLSDSRRALRRVGDAADTAIEKELLAVAVSVSAKARARAPVRTGKLRASIRPGLTIVRGASVTSRLPYASVHEYGGTISPRGVPIEIQRSAMITGAIESSDAAINAALWAIGNKIERAWER